MGGGVQVALATVVATGDDLAVADDDGPDRDLALCCREPGLLEREARLRGAGFAGRLAPGGQRRADQRRAGDPRATSAGPTTPAPTSADPASAIPRTRVCILPT